MSTQATTNLVQELRKLGANEKDELKARAAKIVLGASVIRVFKKDTKRGLVKCLKSLDLESLSRCETQSQFDEFFFEAMGRVDRAILKKNTRDDRVGKGHKWGHAAKITCLFTREIVLSTRYFDDPIAARLKPLLYTPIDGIAIKRLIRSGNDCGIHSIKQIDSKAKFWRFQDLLNDAATRAGVPRIVFDYVWSQERNAPN